MPEHLTGHHNKVVIWCICWFSIRIYVLKLHVSQNSCCSSQHSNYLPCEHYCFSWPVWCQWSERKLLEVADHFGAQYTIKLSNIKSLAPFCVRQESPTRKTTPSAYQDLCSVFFAKKHVLPVPSVVHQIMTAADTSALPMLSTHELFITVKSWTTPTLQGKPHSSPELVTADSCITRYDAFCWVCVARHTERMSCTTHPLTKCHILRFIAAKTSNSQSSVCFYRRLTSVMWLLVWTITCTHSAVHLTSWWLECHCPCICEMGHAVSETSRLPVDHIVVFYTMRIWNLNLPLHITLKMHNCFSSSN
jgi:hypothetical protein